MKRRSITEKPKKRKGLSWFLIILIILGFIVSVYLFGFGAIKEIIHP
jgi:Na+-translocating ferredoxin:NAD+ oxidoreductase RnfD subunit